MKTVPFSDILAGVCQLVGLDRNTLNDKAFAAVRDLAARRMSMIWDREEWPDTERVLNTFVGTPVIAATFNVSDIATESGVSILMESGVAIYTETTSSLKIRLTLETNEFPRTYLAEFQDNAYRKGTIGETYLRVLNSFYITKPDGTKISLTGNLYVFEYVTATDGFGEYITDVNIEVEIGTFLYPTYKGANHPLTTKIVFQKNPNLLVCLQDNVLQGLAAYTGDPRNTTKLKPDRFIVEDLGDKNDISVGGSAKTQEFSYLRFYNDSEKFITYRKPCPRFFGLAYNSTLPYAAGAQAFYDPYQASAAYNPTNNGAVVKGDFWDANIATDRGIPPSTTSLNWSVVEIPYRFKDFLINGTSADFLRSEGRADEANIFDNLAEVSVQQQIDVLLRQQGQVMRMDMAYTY